MAKQHHFIVNHRDDIWQYTYRGSIFAHFKSRQEAIDAAIAAARATNEPYVQVLVQDADMKQEMVWRPDAADEAPEA
ncbi:MAG TPA: hypothetical protein VGV07_01240 [Devosia sp.]|jgi:hypothetical protein|uniref:hypothetical protein n=1 Tax=Devosia sp. TaxID=1871048 RepID=UPI002DDCA0A7|nr:hypothetical protein [Devosia sp.]HEV2513846.1 hypothetical protein [Devosia sp.]